MARALLRLASAEEAANRIDLPLSDAKLTDPQWAKFEQDIRSAFSKGLLAQRQSAKSTALADALNRMIPPWVAEPEPRAKKDPSRIFQDQALSQYFQWLQKRYHTEDEANAFDPLLREFYLNAEQKLRPLVPN